MKKSIFGCTLLLCGTLAVIYRCTFINEIYVHYSINILGWAGVALFIIGLILNISSITDKEKNK